STGGMILEGRAMKNLLEHWRSLPKQEYEAAPRYYAYGDFLTYFLTDRRCVAKRVNELLTIYACPRDGSLVGCKVKGVRLIMSDLRRLHITISDGNTTLGIILLSLLAKAKDDEKVRLQEIIEKFSAGRLPDEIQALAA
ncbi:MAG TPA: hypothetical protein VL175_17335, partial [Pirellulales bacterium]|nr:hypothetical protein [Pirellulales bacterium]